MHVCSRAVLYLARKKEKSAVLFLIFLLVSALLLTCFSIFDGTAQAAKDLRSGIGAVISIRPYAQMSFEDGTVSEGETPVMSRESIEEAADAVGEELKAYNTEHYGYVKSGQLHFLPGSGDDEDSNMGRVTAVRDSSLTNLFLNEEYILKAGRHIQPEDENKILISEELAAENGLEEGDIITLTHAGLGQQNGGDIDTIPEKTFFTEAEIVGIFQCGGAQDSADSPTAGKAANHIISDSRLLITLGEQQEGIFEGEISFFIADPLELDSLIRRVEGVGSIDWNSHILRENDFQYEQIAGQLKNLQNMVRSVILISSVLSIGILLLVLLLQFRGRLREAGIYLSAGKSELEIIGQFGMETAILMILGFLPALLLIVLCTDALNSLLFGNLIRETGAEALQAGAGENYLQLSPYRSVMLFLGELGAALLAAAAAGSTVLRLKPKELLTKLS